MIHLQEFLVKENIKNLTNQVQWFLGGGIKNKKNCDLNQGFFVILQNALLGLDQDNKI